MLALFVNIDALKKTECIELEKAQLIRLVDVFVIGPIILYAATKIEDDFLQVLLIIIGISTIVYNLKNYVINRNSQNQIN